MEKTIKTLASPCRIFSLFICSSFCRRFAYAITIANVKSQKSSSNEIDASQHKVLRTYKVMPSPLRFVTQLLRYFFFFFYLYELSEPPWQMYNKTLFHTATHRGRTLRKSRVTRSHVHDQLDSMCIRSISFNDKPATILHRS